MAYKNSSYLLKISLFHFVLPFIVRGIGAREVSDIANTSFILANDKFPFLDVLSSVQYSSVAQSCPTP